VEELLVKLETLAIQITLQDKGLYLKDALLPVTADQQEVYMKVEKINLLMLTIQTLEEAVLMIHTLVQMVEIPELTTIPIPGQAEVQVTHMTGLLRIVHTTLGHLEVLVIVAIRENLPEVVVDIAEAVQTTADHHRAETIHLEVQEAQVILLVEVTAAVVHQEEVVVALLQVEVLLVEVLEINNIIKHFSFPADKPNCCWRGFFYPNF
jgi:hypothetical protein